ncbi:DNA cytosine methyltransferase [Spirulina sp. CS-785/01]|uniref:DNA cytosine methyltransferase n=1 Tax=Spirulina sp. CS-785/01 TaxID=3021716 RepID=UPI00232F52E7|nr:DNA cytosine methyltransferase [Spirulina sp. CS-785/01]MDB9313932.1 DNA cytosine methyltransferase [Spirulina sp. CS-785/01]
MLPKINVFSFFAGAGFLDLGFENSGFSVVYVNEIYSPFLEAYQKGRQYLNIEPPKYGYSNQNIEILLQNRQALKLQTLMGDIDQSGEISCFLGGPPCPDFSVGGKNKGQKGSQGKFTKSYIDLVCQHNPDFFVFENVKGLYRTKKHRAFFESLKNQLNSHNYILTEKLINSIEYGVPQDRDRIILIGFKRSFLQKLGFHINATCAAIPERQFPWENNIIYSKNNIFNLSWLEKTPFEENSILPCPSNIPQELTVEYWFRKNDTINHPNAKHYFKPRAGLVKMKSIAEGDDSRKSYKRLHRWRYSPTACYGNNEVHLHPYKARRISVAEALALQSMPKEFTLPDTISLTAMFQTIGNGVPYLAAKGIAKTIIDFLQNPEKIRIENQTQQLELSLIF